MINELTKLQAQQLIEFRESCLSIGLSTAPMDKQLHQELVSWLYKKYLGIEKSPYIWYVDSPLMYNFVINIVNYVEKNFEENLENNLCNNLGENLRNNLRNNLWENLRNNLGENLRNNLRNNLWENLRNNLGENLRNNLRNNLWENLRNNLGENLRNNLRNNLWENLRNNLGENLRNNLRNNLWENLRNNLGENLKLFYNIYWTNSDISWISFYLYPMLFLKEDIYSNENSKDLKNIFNLFSNIGCIFFHKNICFISERPVEIHKTGIQLHNENGPSVLFKDGYCIWNLNGVNVTKEIVMTPAVKLDPNLVLKEQNAEVRREIVRKIGINRVIEKLGATVVESWKDASGRQYELINFSILNRDRPYLKMKNPSVDTWHIEGVHPECNTIEKALAWRNHQWEPGTNFNKYEEPIELT